MKNSLSLGKIGGIRITVHWTFFLLILWVVFLNWSAHNNATDTFWSVLFVLMIFGSVVLHELGHAFAARRFGIKTQSITLLPIGGLARLDAIPEKPKEELVVAVAGPLVNLLIALLVYPFVIGEDPIGNQGLVQISQDNLLANFLAVNVMLALFNLLPAFPMDGGRVLRALLSFRLKRHIATRISASIGQGVSVLFILLGFFYNPILVFIGLFIFLGAKAEAGYTKTQFIMQGFLARDAMITHFATLDEEASLEDAVKQLLDGQAHNFLVLQNGRPVGTLGRNDIIKGLTQWGKSARVGEVMNNNLLRFEDRAPLSAVWSQMQQKRQSLAPVFSDSQLIGVLDSENIVEFVLVQEASNQQNVS